MIIIQNSAAPHYLPWCIQKCIILTQSTALLFMSRIWRLTWWSRTKSENFIMNCDFWNVHQLLFVSKEDDVNKDLICAYNHSKCNPHNGTCIRNLSRLGRQPFYIMGVLSFLLVALNWLHSIFAFAYNVKKIKARFL